MQQLCFSETLVAERLNLARTYTEIFGLTYLNLSIDLSICEAV